MIARLIYLSGVIFQAGFVDLGCVLKVKRISWSPGSIRTPCHRKIKEPFSFLTTKWWRLVKALLLSDIEDFHSRHRGALFLLFILAKTYYLSN